MVNLIEKVVAVGKGARGRAQRQAEAARRAAAIAHQDAIQAQPKLRMPVTCWRCNWTFEAQSFFVSGSGVQFTRVAVSNAAEICPRCQARVRVTGEWSIERHAAAGMLNITSGQRTYLVKLAEDEGTTPDELRQALEETGDPHLKVVAKWMWDNRDDLAGIVQWLVRVILASVAIARTGDIEHLIEALANTAK